MLLLFILQLRDALLELGYALVFLLDYGLEVFYPLGHQSIFGSDVEVAAGCLAVVGSVHCHSSPAFIESLLHFVEFCYYNKHHITFN